MGKKILFVDDSTSMREIVGMAMSDAGYEVTTAEDGNDGVGKMENDKFDAIISDLNMPNMNGIEMIKAAKNNANNKFTPVIMLTTESSDDMKQQGKDAGAKVWIVKPFKPDQLIDVLKKLLG
ncbi:MAG: response regulator [Gammaproteobacteria bacterium]|nr:response regulator [Gammaproteobacteria bacterium]